MAKVTLGRTGFRVEQNGFGALPIQRIPKREAVYLLQKALDGGINFYDTARGYSDSEEKLGEAFTSRRDEIVLATKTMAKDVKGFWDLLHTSLKMLKTDYIDLYQFHLPQVFPKPEDGSGLYEAMLAAKEQGKIRYIGITHHRRDVAHEAVKSKLYDTLMYPFSYLSTVDEIELMEDCKKAGMGFIAMKALSGGLITNAKAACAWMLQFDSVVPIWGIQRESELDEFISFIGKTPLLDDEMKACIEADKSELQSDFCRGCGYCMPCPQGIVINMSARASLMIRRSPTDMLLSEHGREMMSKVESCVDCRQCVTKCPYGLDIPSLLKKNYEDYKEILAGKSL